MQALCDRILSYEALFRRSVRMAVAEVPSQAEDTAMMPIVQRVRVLHAIPIDAGTDHISLRSYRGKEDTGNWLTIRNSAFANLETAGRAWNETNFRREFLEQSWWKPEWMWFAFTSDQEASNSPVGTVTLAVRRTPAGLRPAVHWLCVLPEWCRRGVARLLMATLERAAWDAGHRQIWLETHASWKDAAAFYDQLGYVSVNHGAQS